MSVYDFTTFKNSPFGENITYSANGAAGVSIKAVVFRKGAEQTQGSKGGMPVTYFPVVIEIDRQDIANAVEQKDTVQCKDIHGATKTFVVKKILYSDDGCYKLGLS